MYKKAISDTYGNKVFSCRISNLTEDQIMRCFASVLYTVISHPYIQLKKYERCIENFLWLLVISFASEKNKMKYTRTSAFHYNDYSLPQDIIHLYDIINKKNFPRFDVVTSVSSTLKIISEVKCLQQITSRIREQLQ